VRQERRQNWLAGEHRTSLKLEEVRDVSERSRAEQRPALATVGAAKHELALLVRVSSSVRRQDVIVRK
jgi:hypothetical protein